MTDNTEPTKTRSQQHEITIRATPEALWNALTDAEEITRWFCDYAKVEPGVGGRMWASWGETPEEGPGKLIVVWEPGKRLLVRLPESEADTTQTGVPIMIEYTLETQGNVTVLRLVHSNIPDSPDWEAYYEGTNRGWPVFFLALKFYLERHPGQTRQTITFMRPITGTPESAWQKLTGKEGLAAEGCLQELKAGDDYSSVTSAGDKLEGKVLLIHEPKILCATVESMDGALLSAALECMGGMNFAYITLSFYGMGAEEFAVRKTRWMDWLGEVLPMPAPQQPEQSA